MLALELYKTGFTTSNAFEIQVLDDLSFSQNTSSETVTLTEGGAVPVRGQRSFNTALEPADVSFTTYMRPADGGTNITAEESVLWNALLLWMRLEDCSCMVGGYYACYLCGYELSSSSTPKIWIDCYS